jgi:O-antigen/teichoic acid export membrane protein
VVAETPFKTMASLLRYGIVSQAFYFLTIPIVLIKFTSDGYGVFTGAFAVSSIIGSVAAMRLERAIVIEDELRVRTILIYCFVAIGICSGICLLVTQFALRAFTVGMFEKNLLSIISVVYCCMFGIVQVMIHLAIRRKQVVLSGVSDLLFTSTLALLLFIVPLQWMPEAITIFAAFILARFVSLVPFFSMAKNEFTKQKTSNHAHVPLKVLKEYLVPVFTAILSNIQFRGLFYLTGYHYGGSTTGNLALTQRIVYAPVNLIGASLRKSFFLEFTENADDFSTVSSYMEKVLILGSAVSICLYPVFIAICHFGGQFMPTDWQLTPLFAVVIYPTASILCLLSWLDRIYDAKRKQAKALLLEIIYTIVLYIAVFAALSLSVSAILLILIFSCITVVYNVIWALLTFNLVDCRLRAVYGLGAVHAILLAVATVYVSSIQ